MKNPRRKTIKIDREQCYVGRHINSFGEEVLARFDFPILQDKTGLEILLSSNPMSPLFFDRDISPEKLNKYCTNNNVEGRWEFSKEKIIGLPVSEYMELVLKAAVLQVNLLQYQVDSLQLKRKIADFEDGSLGMFHIFTGNITDEERKELDSSE